MKSKCSDVGGKILDNFGSWRSLTFCARGATDLRSKILEDLRSLTPLTFGPREVPVRI